MHCLSTWLLISDLPFGSNISPLTVEITQETNERLHVKIYDPNNQRWEVPTRSGYFFIIGVGEFGDPILLDYSLNAVPYLFLMPPPLLLQVHCTAIRYLAQGKNSSLLCLGELGTSLLSCLKFTSS